MKSTSVPVAMMPPTFPHEARRGGDAFGGRPPAYDADADGIVSCSPGLRDALAMMERVAPTDTTVLLTGETGTGTQVMARALHRRSHRAERPLITANLAAIPESLVASELFGHEPGAFTGAVQRRIGRFLDEVGELSPEMQVALLRVVQDGEFERLGGSQTRKVDVRLITATNRNMEQAVEEQRFRPDLFYRLSVFPIQLPPLRERREDIPPLAEYFLRGLEKRLSRRFSGVEPDSMERLMAFSWPGNIRQLQNVIEQAAILCDEPVLRIPRTLVSDRRQPLGVIRSRPDNALHATEQQLIEKILRETEGRVSGPQGAAARLGVPPSTLESKIRRFHIDKLRYRNARV
jgi:formate hydrogenlyase transcriptional activator